MRGRGPAIASTGRARVSGTMIGTTLLFVAGNSRWSSLARSRNAVRARASETPERSRPYTLNQSDSGSFNHRSRALGLSSIGDHASVRIIGAKPVKRDDTTPITVRGSPSTWMTRPRIAESARKRRTQNS